jgi:hypothetical protein
MCVLSNATLSRRAAMTPTDRSSSVVACPQCGAQVPAGDGPVHPYFGAAPGCWALYGAVLARAYEDRRCAQRHQLAVDAYAAQHPGRSDDRRAVQSVAVHLIGLHLALAPATAGRDTAGRDTAGRDLAPLLRAAADRSVEFRALPRPTHLGAITVVDVHAASATGAPDAYLAAVRRWADAVWAAWAAHHAEVGRWAALLLAAPQRSGRREHGPPHGVPKARGR